MQRNKFHSLLKAVLAGGLVVAVAALLARRNAATPIPFFVLSPGLLVATLVHGNGFNPEGDTQPWSLASVYVMYAVNVALYASLFGLFAFIFRRRRRASK